MIALLDPATAADLATALRRYEGVLRAQGQALSPGAAELLRSLDRSGPVTNSQPQAHLDVDLDDCSMPPRLVPADTAERYLSVSSSTLARLTRDGEIPTVRIGRRRLYDLADLDQFVDTRKSAA